MRVTDFFDERTSGNPHPQSSSGRRGQLGSRHEKSMTGGAPLSFAQERIWLLHQQDPSVPLHNLPQAVRLVGPLDLQILKRSLADIVRRHEILRSHFLSHSGIPLQVVSPPEAVPLTVVDLPEAANTPDFDWRLMAESRRPFDLGRDLMLHATLFRLLPNDHVLLLVVHEIAADAWSVTLLLQELATLYQSYRRGEEPRLPRLPFHYAAFGSMQRQQVEAGTFARQIAYWKRELADAPHSVRLPTKPRRPAGQTISASVCTRILPAELRQALNNLARQEDATFFMTVLAAFQVLLHRYAGQTNLTVGSPFFGRSAPETDNLIGPFLNTLLLRADCSGDPTFRDFLARVRTVAVEAFGNSDVPFEVVLEAMQPDLDFTLCNVIFALQRPAIPVLKAADLQLQPIYVHPGVAAADMTMSVQEIESGLLARLEYKTELFAADAIDKMLADFQSLLQSIVQNQRQRLSELPLPHIASFNEIQKCNR